MEDGSQHLFTHAVQKILPEHLWKKELGEDGTHTAWYSKAVEYWDKQEASYNGVLGGYGCVSSIDIRDSKALLLKAFKLQFERHKAKDLVAVDTGAGVGRVTKQLLLHFFGTVDVLEPSAHLLAKARASLPPVATVPGIPPGHTAGRFFQQGLESFEPEPGRYDCIWVQWCLLYLTDDDLIACLRRAATGLKGGGRIVVKENICKKGFVVDRSDSSLTRSTAYLSGLFARADMATIYSAKQRGMPEELFEVRMFVLQPRCASVSAPALLGSGSKRKATEDMQEQDASSPGQA